MRVLKPAEWPWSENRPLAHLGMTASDLGETTDIEFTEQLDDLGEAQMAVIELPSGVVVWLVEYPGGRPGTSLLGPAEHQDPDALVDGVVASLDLDQEKVEWRVTDTA